VTFDICGTVVDFRQNCQKPTRTYLASCFMCTAEGVFSPGLKRSVRKAQYTLSSCAVCLFILYFLPSSHTLSWRAQKQITFLRHNFLKGRPYAVIWDGYRSQYSDNLRAGRSGDRIPVGTSFSAPFQTGSEAHAASSTMGTGSFPEVSCGRGVMLTPHPLLVPRSKVE
jgi:hypothetical protein